LRRRSLWKLKNSRFWLHLLENYRQTNSIQTFATLMLALNLHNTIEVTADFAQEFGAVLAADVN